MNTSTRFAGVSALGVALAASATAAGEGDGARFFEWFGGEYNNHLQVWQQKEDGVTTPLANVHLRVRPVAASGLQGQAYVVERTRVGAPSAVRRLLSVTGVQADGSLRHTAYLVGEGGEVEQFAADDLVRDPACDGHWRREAQTYRASVDDASCALADGVATDVWQLSATALTLAGADGIRYQNQRVRFFKGWMGVKRDKVEPGAPDEDWIFMSSFSIHNEGQKIALVDKNGRPSGYAVQLERLVYQNTKTPVLKLGLVDESTGKTITYIWSEPGSTRLGMNLRWFQVGLTALTAPATR